MTTYLTGIYLVQLRVIHWLHIGPVIHDIYNFFLCYQLVSIHFKLDLCVARGLWSSFICYIQA